MVPLKGLQPRRVLLLPKLQGYKESIKCGGLGAEISGHCQEKICKPWLYVENIIVYIDSKMEGALALSVCLPIEQVVHIEVGRKRRIFFEWIHNVYNHIVTSVWSLQCLFCAVWSRNITSSSVDFCKVENHFFIDSSNQQELGKNRKCMCLVSVPNP